MERKEEILLATLELAAEKGIGSVSLSQIADRVGIKKASIYNHYKSKDDIIEEMYKYLRQRAKDETNNSDIDYGNLVKGKSVCDVLLFAVHNYLNIVNNDKLSVFYKVIYSERSLNPVAASILVEENNRMILGVKQLFYAIKVHGLLELSNVDMEALAFAMTIHSMIDLYMDLKNAHGEADTEMIDSYIRYFCTQRKPVVD